MTGHGGQGAERPGDHVPPPIVLEEPGTMSPAATGREAEPAHFRVTSEPSTVPLLSDVESPAAAAIDLGPVPPPPLAPADLPPATRPRVLPILLADLVPLVGALFLSWNVFTIVSLYWIENVVVGVFTVLKMRQARGTGLPTGFWATVKFGGLTLAELTRRTRSLVPFFVFYFGVFTAVHGFLIMGIFAQYPGGSGTLAQAAFGVLWYLLSVGSLVAAYSLSYRRDYLGGQQYLRLSPAQLVTYPFGRMLVLHLVVILGGWFVAALGTPVAGLALLVLLKGALDAYTYGRREAAAE